MEASSYIELMSGEEFAASELRGPQCGEWNVGCILEDYHEGHSQHG